jgi:2-polyprenyl-3-methyl-5-hydroxy-6-metoxy-1,4-benzoquinol methylase
VIDCILPENHVNLNKQKGLIGSKSLSTIVRVVQEKFNQGNRPVCILDLGCGKGKFANLISQIPGTLVFGIDIDERSIRIAKQECETSNCHYILGNIEDGGIKSKFDIIVCTDVIEHLYDPDQFVHGMCQLLGDRGIILLGVPNGYGPFELISHLRKWLGQVMAIFGLKKIFKNVQRKMLDRVAVVQSCNIKSVHVQTFSIPKIKRIYQKYGFRITGITNLSFIIMALLLNTPLGVIASPSTKLFMKLEFVDELVVDFVPWFCSGSWLLRIEKI